MDIVIIIATSIVSLAVGFFVALSVAKKQAKNKSNSIISEAKSEAEVIKKDKILEAKEEILKLKSRHEKWSNDKSKDIQRSENRNKQRENTLNQKFEDLKKRQRELKDRKSVV